MNTSTFLLMRHEISLIAVVVLVLIADLILPDKGKSCIVKLFALGLFLINTVIGFMPIEYGQLFGGMYHTSALIVLIKNILNVGVFIVLLQSSQWLKTEENSFKTSEYFILLLSTLIGMNFMISSGDFLMFYIGLEIATIPMAALAAYEVYKTKSAEAGVKLILSAALSSGILLYGISLIYGTTGTIYFSQITHIYTNSALQTLAFIFFFAGMAFKISLVPFHLWTPDVYEGAPVNITSYLSVISKGAAVAVFTLILFTVFPLIIKVWQPILYVIAIATMTIGNLFAVRQQNIKRFLAFSSISQAGFILLGIIGGNQFGMASVIYYILVYIFSNLGAFGVVAIISNMSGKENIDDYNGLYKTNPLLSLTLMLALFSLAGIPPVAGFFGKFFLFTAAFEQGFQMLVLIAVLNTIISLYYYLLVVKAMFINKSENPIEPITNDFITKAGIFICVIGIFVLGFSSSVLAYINSISFGVIK